MTARIALTGADDAFHARLRARFGLTPTGALSGPAATLAYCGADFRVYPSMRVGEASRFFGALHDRWNAATLKADLERAGLRDDFEIRRMKRAFQRTVVLAFALASEPTVLVIEAADEFEEPGAAALLSSAVRRVSRAIVTYGGESLPDASLFTESRAARDFDVAWA